MDKIPSTKRKYICLNFYLHGPNSEHISVFLLLLRTFVLCGFQLLVWPSLILLTVLFCFLTLRADAAKSSRRNCKLWDPSQHWKVSNRYTFSIFTLPAILLVTWLLTNVARGGCVCVAFVNSLECRTCVVIGNGFAIKNSSLGNIINKYDVVIR